MAKRKQAGSPPKLRGDQLILRSTETLGRMIGALQRQLDAVGRRTSQPAQGKNTESPSADTKRAAVARQAAAAKKTTPARKAATVRKTATARKTAKRAKTRRQG
jgi:hypothetical protein